MTRALFLLHLVSVGTLAALSACSGCHRRSVPADAAPWRVSVERNGHEIAVIDPAMLARFAPDNADGDVRAWRLYTLLGDGVDGSLQPDTSVVVEDAQGLRFVLSVPEDAVRGRQPFLALDERGRLRAVLAAGGDVITALRRDGQRELHQERGSRERLIRSILLDSAREPLPTDASFELSASIDGAAGVVWSPHDFAVVPSLDIVPADGEGHRTAWTLRDVTRTLVGDRARVVDVAGAGGQLVSISASQWNDAKSRPVLRLNRRGLLKLEWIASDGSSCDGERLKEVSLVVVRRDLP